jgi:hypothetical protein
MSEKMVRTQVYLPADIYEQLKERGEREGLTLAHQIREALAEYVTTVAEDEALPIITADDPIWNIIGMVESGPPMALSIMTNISTPAIGIHQRPTMRLFVRRY